MAHPFSEHRAQGSTRKRVGHIMKSGGHAHSDVKADKKLISKMISAHERKEHDVPGYARGGRINKYARGGSTKKHPQINIAVVSPGGQRQIAPGAAPGGPPPAPPPLPPRPPVGAMPGGMPPAMMGPPGLPPRPPMKRGGRVKMTAGADTGEGRLQKIRAYGRKAKTK